MRTEYYTRFIITKEGRFFYCTEENSKTKVSDKKVIVLEQGILMHQIRYKRSSGTIFYGVETYVNKYTTIIEHCQ